jgi:hypothetical protein
MQNPTDSRRDLRLLRFSFGTSALLVSAVAIVLLVQSRSKPWLFGGQNEPDWSWAVGSGRLKLWLADRGAFSADETWPASWYRGLDGKPIRWGFTAHRGTTGGVTVIAVPLWTVGILAGFCGIFVFWHGRKRRREAT